MAIRPIILTRYREPVGARLDMAECPISFTAFRNAFLKNLLPVY